MLVNHSFLNSNLLTKANHTGNPVETKKLVSPPSVKNKELPAEKELNSASKDATGRYVLKL